MTSKRARTALMLFGAGASLDYGAPSTGALTDLLRDAGLSDRWMRESGGAEAHARISATLAGYYRGGEDAVNFEQIYHCAHELIYARPPSAGAVDAFRPALSPFVAAKVDLDERALVSLIGFMADTIFETLASACARPASSLAPLARFIADVRADCVTRIYTTNYDDFILQSCPDLFTGFPEATVGRRLYSSTSGARVSSGPPPSTRPTTGCSRCGTSYACTSAMSRGGTIIRTMDGRSMLAGPARSGTAASRHSSRTPTAMAQCCSASA